MLPSYYSTIQSNPFRLSILITTLFLFRQIRVGSFSLEKLMNPRKNNSKDPRGKGPTTQAINRSLRFDSNGDGPSRNVVKNPHKNVHQSSKSAPSSPSPTYEEDYPALGASVPSTSKRKTRIDLGSQQKMERVDSSQFTGVEITQSGENYIKHEEGTGKIDVSEDSPKAEPFKTFDICFSRRRNYSVAKASIRAEDKGKQVVDFSGRRSVLRPGMVLLRRYINVRDQIQIVRICQKLGKGPGGFYQPGYKSGAKFRLQMMCLGLNWDPETREYEALRSSDGCEAPAIPDKFIRLVRGAIRDAHALIKKEVKVDNVEDILPAMSADICIVNFYNTAGRLGLHQDRDETEYSLRKGLPVVSFSVGDSAEFLYGDERDVNKAERIVLESGDVLVFGGDSRHIFHGVSSVIPNSAPVYLLRRTNFRPGRLNLTFREY